MLQSVRQLQQYLAPQQTANKLLQSKEELQGVLVKGKESYLHCILLAHRYDHSATRFQLLNQVLQQRNHA